MSKLTVQAMDSAAAMDEIISKLGPDAVILSTTKLNGKVIMEAASGALPSQMQPRDEKKFTNIFSEQMIKTPHNRLVDSKSRITMSPPILPMRLLAPIYYRTIVKWIASANS